MARTRRARLLVVDDHVEMARVLSDQLRDEGYTVEIANGGVQAVALVKTQAPDLVLTDLRMKDVDGMDVLNAVRTVDPGVPVIIMTAFGAVETAVEAMRRGAFHYLTKPFQLAEVLLVVDRALENRRLREENAFLRSTHVRHGSPQLIGESEAMNSLVALIRRVSLARAPALLRGESGTGKELVARAIHAAGPRQDAPFVAVNCTTLPEQLLESELFGHVKGAFTGAAGARRGLFAEADGGTLFLDEIGDMPAPLQARLLRVLEDGEIRPVGGDQAQHVDVRVIAATHRDLEERSRAGSFRADLYYRLDVATLHLPPLRERRDDIPLLLGFFLGRSRARNPHSPVSGFTEGATAALRAAPWPGNVRELENAVERIVVMSTSTSVDEEEVFAFVPSMRRDPPALARGKERFVTLRDLEDEYIAWVLAQVGGQKQKAAEILGVDVSTLYRREKGK